MSRELAALPRLDRLIAVFSPRMALRRQVDRIRLEALAAYRGASPSRLRQGWSSSLTRPTPRTYDLQRLREFSRDLNRNDPVASGATETMALNIVGRGLQPQSRLRAKYLGISEEQARDLQLRAELVWNLWAPHADAGNRLNFDELQYLALRKVVEDGEVLALPVGAPDPWRQITRAVELLEADRLTGIGAQTEIGRETGIDVGERGEPQFYNFTKVDPRKNYVLTGSTERVAARDNQGRPRVIHLYRTKRPGQQRGEPLFAPVITYFQDLADYLEAKVVKAKVCACISAAITKKDPYGAASAAASGTDVASGKPLETFEPGAFYYLGEGEEITKIDFEEGGEDFKTFLEGVLRIIGAALNLPYELLLKDFSQTNYSSARAALLEGWRMFTTWRFWFAAKFCQIFWDMVLEEAFLMDLFPAPNFYDFQAEYCRCEWIGPTRGWVDPVKEVTAAKLSEDYGYSTKAEICASQGNDWEETADQKKREQEKYQELELTIPLAPQVTIVDQGNEGGQKNAQAQ